MFRQAHNPRTVTLFPESDLLEKQAAIVMGVNTHDLEKYLPQFAGITASGVLSTPHESLALYVHQTALDDDIRPQLS